MGPDLTAPPRATACPSCGASARPDAQWCGQCYADFRPAPEVVHAVPHAVPVAHAAPPSAPAPTAVYGVAAADPLTQPLTDFLPRETVAPASGVPEPRSEPTWPCSLCEARNVLTATTCAACGGGFLAGLKDGEKPMLVLPLVGDVGAMTRGRRLALAAALIAAIVVPLAAVTLLTSDSPPEQPRLITTETSTSP